MLTFPLITVQEVFKNVTTSDDYHIKDDSKSML